MKEIQLNSKPTKLLLNLYKTRIKRISPFQYNYNLLFLRVLVRYLDLFHPILAWDYHLASLECEGDWFVCSVSLIMTSAKKSTYSKLNNDEWFDPLAWVEMKKKLSVNYAKLLTSLTNWFKIKCTDLVTTNNTQK